MSCIPCFLTKAIPVCIQEITLGAAEASTNYDVYVTNANTGYTQKIAVTSDVTGLITVDVSNIEFSPNHKYEFKAAETGDSIDKAVIIAVEGQPEGTETTCLLVPFFRVFGEDQQTEAVLELDLTCECE